MSQLPIYLDEDTGEPRVECPSCGELVAPERNPLLDSYDCSCGVPMELSAMRGYARARRRWAESKRDEEWDG